MCTVLLPPGVNPIAVNKYINTTISTNYPEVSLVKPDPSPVSVCIEIFIWNPTTLHPPDKPIGSYVLELFLFLHKPVNTQLRLFIASSPEQP
jgi:hypothetical protein